MLVLGACRADAHVDIVVDPDGRGRVDVEVTFDDALLGVVGGPDGLERAVAGLGDDWEVSVATRPEVMVELGRNFGSIDELAVALDDLEDAGLFRSGSLTAVDERDLRTWTLLVELDLGVQPEDFANDELTAALDGRPFGLSDQELEALVGEEPEGLHLEVTMRLPGEMTGVSEGMELAEDGTAAWSGRVGEGSGYQLSASSQVVDEEALELRDDASDRRGVALLLLVIAAAVGAVAWLIGVRRSTGRRHRASDEEPPSGSGSAAGDDIVVFTGSTDLSARR